MSNIALSPNASGTATFTIAAPGTSTNRTLTLPDATTTLVGTDATQTLTNKTVQGGTVTQATAQNSTSGTNIDFTGIPSWAKKITVLFNGVSTNGTSAVQVQLGDAGGFETTGYAGATGISANGGTAGGAISSGFVIDGNTTQAATSTRHGLVVIANLSGNIWAAHGAVGESVNGRVQHVAGAKTLSDVLTQVRITTVNGTDTFDAGSINIMYEG